MAWIKSNEEIGQHPKTYALATALNADLPTAVGVLHLLWHFTLKFSWRTGDLKKYSQEAIAQAIGWRGDPHLLINALQKSGWLDRMRVHDWLDYAGKIIDDRLYNEKRRTTSSNGVSFRKSTARVEKSRVEKSRVEKNKENTLAQAPKGAPFSKPSVEQVNAYCQTQGFKLDAKHFWDHYEANGWKVGRNPMKDWQAAVRTWMRSEFRREEKNGTHERKSIFDVPNPKGWTGGHHLPHSELRKVSSAWEILNGIRNLSVPTAHRSEESAEPH